MNATLSPDSTETQDVSSGSSLPKKWSSSYNLRSRRSRSRGKRNLNPGVLKKELEFQKIFNKPGTQDLDDVLKKLEFNSKGTFQEVLIMINDDFNKKALINNYEDLSLYFYKLNYKYSKKPIFKSLNGILNTIVNNVSKSMSREDPLKSSLILSGLLFLISFVVLIPISGFLVSFLASLLLFLGYFAFNSFMCYFHKLCR